MQFFLFSGDINIDLLDCRGNVGNRTVPSMDGFIGWAGASDLSFNFDFSSNRFASLKRSVVVALSFLR